MISVIVPAYNAVEFLEAAVQSVQAQTYSVWELIIVDDGSKDGTFALAQSLSGQDSRVKALTQKNGGVSVARNFGFASARLDYPYALFLDSDDLLVPDSLHRLLSVLQPQPDTPAACGLVQEVDASGAALDTPAYFETILNRRGVEGRHLVRRDPADGISFGDLCFHNYITTPGSALIRKSAIASPVVFDPAQGYTADWDFWWRLTMKSGPIAVVPETVLLYRIHGASMSQNRTVARQGVFAFQRNLLRYPGMSEAQKQTAKWGFFHHSVVYTEYAGHAFKKGQVKKGLKQMGLAARDLLRFAKGSFA